MLALLGTIFEMLRKHTNILNIKKYSSLVLQQVIYPVYFYVLALLSHLALTLARMLAHWITLSIQLFRGVINCFKGVVSSNEHVHIYICVVMEAKVALNTKSLGVFVGAVANSTLPALFLLLFVFFFLLPAHLSHFFAELSPVSFWHFELEG